MNFPSQVDTSTIQSVIRREFRDDISSVSKSFDHLTRRQVAFTALRELNRKISFFEKAKYNSPEYLPQQAAWHVSPLPFSPPAAYLKPGAFLVSHPKMTDSFFSKSVICLLDRKYNNGQTYGVIINRTSVNTETGKNRTLKEAFDDNMLPTKLAEAFGDLEVKRGGPVHVALQMLYSLPGSEENSIGGSIIPMIPDDEDSSTAIFSDRATYFQGDVFKAITAVEKGTLDRGTSIHYKQSCAVSSILCTHFRLSFFTKKKRILVFLLEHRPGLLANLKRKFPKGTGYHVEDPPILHLQAFANTNQSQSPIEDHWQIFGYQC